MCATLPCVVALRRPVTMPALAVSHERTVDHWRVQANPKRVSRANDAGEVSLRGPANASPSCLAKSSKSLTLSVAGGTPYAMQHAATHMSLIGLGRPRACARASSVPHLVATRSSNGSVTTCRRQAVRSANRRAPQLHRKVQEVNSPTVTNVIANDCPVSRASIEPGKRRRMIPDATSVSRTT